MGRTRTPKTVETQTPAPNEQTQSTPEGANPEVSQTTAPETNADTHSETPPASASETTTSPVDNTPVGTSTEIGEDKTSTETTQTESASPENESLDLPATPSESQSDQEPLGVDPTSDEPKNPVKTEQVEEEIDDTVTEGNPTAWQIISRVSSKKKGFIRETRAMNTGKGVLVLVSSRFFNPYHDRTITACSENVQFIPGMFIGTDGYGRPFLSM